MPKKPANLIYSVDENPPAATTALLGLQHVFALSTVLSFPVVLVREMGGSPDQTERLIDASMVVMGIATVLQSLRYGPIGSGYLCPERLGVAYLSVSLLAVKAGGLPLLAGMTIVSGLFGVLLSRVARYVRPLFPTEVTGTIVLMVALELVPRSVSWFLGIERSKPTINPLAVTIASITFFVMAAVTVWGSSKLRLYGVLIGVGVGYLYAFASGLVTGEHLHRLEQAPFLSLPSFPYEGWSFSGALLVPFLVTALASSLKTVGDLTTCQKVNDAEWKRPDMRSISGGILADACGVLLSGGLGTMGQSTGTSNIGLATATGATSRRIGFACGAILILLAFVPKLVTFFAIMPLPVIGALLLFSVIFILVSGIQILTSRMMDARKTFVVGTSIVLGLSVDMLPGAYERVPAMFLPIFTSSLSVATVSALLLNLLFRIGIAQRATLELEAGVDFPEKIFSFMEAQGGAWGARKEVIDRAKSAMNELVESVRTLGLATGNLSSEVSFDEFNLDVVFRYNGTLMEFPAERPAKADLLADDKAVAKLAGFLIRHSVDRVRSDQAGGRCRVHFHLDH